MSLVSHRTAKTTAAATAFALVLINGSFAPASAQVLDSGHVDAFYVTAPGGELTLSLKEDVTGSGVVHSGSDVTLRVAEQAWNEATEGIDGIGQPTYYLPQTQDSSLLWPGWDTQPAQSAGYTDIDFEFVEVTGPGDIFVFETAGFGDIKPVTNAGEMDLVSGDVINQAYPAHRHVNWAFTDPGIYTMTVQAVSNGDASNQVTYTWDVGDGESAPVDDENTSDSADGGGNAEGAAPNNSANSSDADAVSPAGTAQTQRAAGAASGKDTAWASSNRSNKNSKDNAQSKERKERAARKPARNGSTVASDDDVDTVAASGYYDSGQNLLPWGIGILGLGMLVLGLALARLALLKGRD